MVVAYMGLLMYFSSISLPRFSVNGWSHTSGNTPAPVVVEARPQSAADLTGGIVHSYSFLDFFFIDPEFQPQREIWCRGAVNPPPLPKLPRRFDVNLEYVTSDSTRMWGKRVSKVPRGYSHIKKAGMLVGNLEKNQDPVFRAWLEIFFNFKRY